MGSFNSTASMSSNSSYSEGMPGYNNNNIKNSNRDGISGDSGDAKGNSDSGVKVSKEPYLSSTGGLQIVLQQHFLRENFRNFAAKHWCSNNKAKESSSQQAANRAYALNCIDFWTDLRDLSLLSNSTFQNFRACYIYEKYIMHGAVRHIPTSPNVQDDCHETFHGEGGICNNMYGGMSSSPSSAISGGTVNPNPPSHYLGSGGGFGGGFSANPPLSGGIFAAVEVEVLDYLVSEIYPSFEKTSLSMIARKHSHEMMEVIKNGMAVGRRGSLFNSPDKAPLNAIMHKILSDNAYLALFKNYMVQSGRQNELYAYNDIIELKEKLNNIESGETIDQDIKVSVYMSSIHEFYELYLSIGAPCKVILSEATLGDFRYRIAQQPTMMIIQGGSNDRRLFASTQTNEKSSCGNAVTTTPASPHNNNNDKEGCRAFPLTSDSNIDVMKHLYQPLLSPENHMDAAGAGAAVAKPITLDKTISANGGAEKEKPASVGGIVYRCDAEALQPIEHDLFESFIRNHLDPFLSSPGYKQVVLSGRRMSVVSQQPLVHLVAATSVSADSQEKSIDPLPAHDITNQSEHISIVESPKERLHSIIDHGSEIGALSSSNAMQEADCKTVPSLVVQSTLAETEKFLRKKELKNFIKSGYDHVFGRYLESCSSTIRSTGNSSGTANSDFKGGGGSSGSGCTAFSNSVVYMHFYQSASRFQEYYFSNNMDKTAECMYIYERYISRNAEESICLPIELKNNISKLLLRGSQSIYYEAAEWAIDYLSENNWVKFKRYVTDKSKASSSWIRGGREGGDPAMSSETFNSPEFAKLAVQQLDSSNSKSSGSGSSEAETNQFVGSSTEKQISSSLFGSGFFSNLIDINKHAKVISSAPDLSANPSSSIASLSSHTSSPSSVVQTNNELTTTAGNSPALYPTSRRRSIGAPPRITDSLKDVADLTGNSGSYSGGNSGNGAAERASSFKFDAMSRYRNISVGLREVLEHPQCCSTFKEFLDRECGSQTILFLMEIEDFKRIPNPQFQVAKARKIFNKYLHDLAINLVPISKTTKDAIEVRLQSSQVETNLFQYAYDDVLKYVQMYQFSRFQKTPEMNVVVSILSTESQSIKKNRRRSSISLDNHSSIKGGSSSSFKIDCIKQVLQYQSATLYFKDFCIKTYCHENLMFWLDAEYYSNLPSSDFMKRTSVKICKKYIFTDARLQINISGPIRAEILKNVNGGPNRVLFKKAQAEILKLLETDAFPKFLASAEYELMKKNLDSSPSDAGSAEKSDGVMTSLVHQLGF